MENKIGIIGSGVVSMSLANGLIKHGYQVMVGTNDQEKYAAITTTTNGMA